MPIECLRQALDPYRRVQGENFVTRRPRSGLKVVRAFTNPQKIKIHLGGWVGEGGVGGQLLMLSSNLLKSKKKITRVG